MSDDSIKIGSKCFKETLLNNLSDTDRIIIDSAFYLAEDNNYYVLKEGLTEEVKTKLNLVLNRLGYNFSPTSDFNAFYNEIYENYFKIKAQPDETWDKKELLTKIAQLEEESKKRLEENMNGALELVKKDFEIEKKAQEIKEKNLELDGKKSDQKVREDLLTQITDQRGMILNFLMKLMASETIILFTIVILASIPSPYKLKINDPTLQILVGATIAQISAMVVIVIRSVFPDSINKILGTNDAQSTDKDKKSDAENKTT